MGVDTLCWNDVLKYARLGNPTAEHKVVKTPLEWQEQLTREQYLIARCGETEMPFSSAMCGSLEEGVYSCVCCLTELFEASQKFQSGTGWPSFSQPISLEVIAYHIDDSHGRSRVEVRCNICDAHLGHVFPDGPEPSGLRYCINSVVLRLAVNP